MLEPCHQHSESTVPSLTHCPFTRPCLLQIGDRNGELTARMNIAHLQLALGRLTSPAAAEKPDLAGYEAQGELWVQGLGCASSSGLGVRSSRGSF